MATTPNDQSKFENSDNGSVNGSVIKNNNTLTINPSGEATSPVNGAAGRHLAVSPTPSIFSNNLLNGTPASFTSSNALHKLNPFCPTSVCCCFGGRDKQASTATTQNVLQNTRKNKRSSSTTAPPVKSEWKLRWLKFQEKVKGFVENKWFDSFILLLILSSSFVLVGFVFLRLHSVY